MPDGWAMGRGRNLTRPEGCVCASVSFAFGVYILKLINRPLFTHSHTRVQHTCTHIPVMTGNLSSVTVS